MTDLNRCPRCLKMTDGVHTCTPTEAWRKLEQERDDLQERWDYYQNFVKAHGVESITALVVQRDKLLAVIEKAVRLNSFREFNDHIPAMKAAIASVKGGAA